MIAGEDLEESQYILRRAIEDDAESLALLRLDLFKSFAPDELDPDWLDHDREWLKTSLESKDLSVWLAETPSGESAAMCAVTFYRLPPKPWEMTGLYAYVSSMYTKPEHRRKGLGSKLLKQALEHIKDRGAAHAMLHATPAGIPLYERFGFAQTNEMRLKLGE